MDILKKLREAIERGRGCPVAPAAKLSIEDAERLEAELIRLNARQVTNDMHMREFHQDHV